MKLLTHLFGKKLVTSAAIAVEIDKARAEYTAAVAKRAAALAGLSTMSDGEHIKAEAEFQAQGRAADRAEARVRELEKAQSETLASEAEAEKRAEAERFCQRTEAARHAVEIEAADLLAEYDRHRAAIRAIIAKVNEIDAEAQSCNEAGHRIPGFEAVRSTDAAHRKHADRQGSERRERHLCWVFKYPASPRDTERVKFQPEAAREEVVRATIDPKTGKAIPVPSERYNYFGRELVIRPVLEEREVVVERVSFKPGRVEASLSSCVLPPGLVVAVTGGVNATGGRANWSLVGLGP